MTDSLSWRGFSTRGLGWRIFASAWLVFALHFATDVVREHYPAFALGDRLSFRLDEYGGLHPDLFEKEGYGWHIGNNPGVSMFAAVPYALARPVIDPIVRRVQARREASGATEPPSYETEWPNQAEFYAEAYRRGLDVKLALGALVTQVFFMAPACAASAVLIFLLFLRLLGSARTAVWLALLYAFGTPLFYRAGFLNHNMLLGLIAFAAFVYVWDPWERAPTARSRYAVAGLAAGLTVLFDYSGVVFFVLLFVHAVWAGRTELKRPADWAGALVWFGVGAIGPIAALWFYQWRAFGHPIYPGQHWMPPVEWIELGYQGYGPPQLDLLWMLAFDHRFGVFAFTPLFLLALAAPLLARRVPKAELWWCLAFSAALWVFFSGSNYTRLQFNTGLRYMAPVVPFLFVATAAVLVRLPVRLAVIAGVAQALWMWCLAMYREVERPMGVFDPVMRTLIEGFDVPVLQALERTGGVYGGLGAGGTSPLPLFLACGLVLYALWARPGGPTERPVADVRHPSGAGGRGPVREGGASHP